MQMKAGVGGLPNEKNSRAINSLKIELGAPLFSSVSPFKCLPEFSAFACAIYPLRSDRAFIRPELLV